MPEIYTYYVLCILYYYRAKFSLLPLKFQEFFNLNLKVSKLTIYPLEVSKNGNLNIPLKFSIKMDGN
jgi:hypothetical protein